MKAVWHWHVTHWFLSSPIAVFFPTAPMEIHWVRLSSLTTFLVVQWPHQQKCRPSFHQHTMRTLRKCMACFFWLIETNPRELKLDKVIRRNAQFLVLNCVSCWYPPHSSHKIDVVIRSPIMIHSGCPNFEALDSYWQIPSCTYTCHWLRLLSQRPKFVFFVKVCNRGCQFAQLPA